MTELSVPPVSALSSTIDNYLAEVRRQLADVDAASLGRFVEFLKDAWSREATVFVAGDGGSAALANHIACDFLKLRLERGGPKVRALLDGGPIITMLANDYSFDDLFALQLRCSAARGDALLVISGSGRSVNLLRAVDEAKTLGLSRFGLIGFSGTGPLRTLVDSTVIVRSFDHRVIEDVHHCVAHAAVAALARRPTTRLAVIDRDGVLGERPRPDAYVTSPDAFRWLPGAIDGIRRLKGAGWSVAVATNQRCIARSFATRAAVDAIHSRLNDDLATWGVSIDAFFVCPHDLVDRCHCRKPATGLLEQAAARFDVSAASCVVIGDSEADVAMGRHVGCFTIGIGTAGGDVTCPDLSAAVSVLLAKQR